MREIISFEFCFTVLVQQYLRITVYSSKRKIERVLFDSVGAGNKQPYFIHDDICDRIHIHPGLPVFGPALKSCTAGSGPVIGCFHFHRVRQCGSDPDWGFFCLMYDSHKNTMKKQQHQFMYHYRSDARIHSRREIEELKLTNVWMMD